MNNPKQTQDVPSLERATGPAASRSGLRGKLLIDSRLIQEYKMSLVRNLLDLPEHIQAVLRGLPDGYAVKVSVKGNRGDYVELDSRSIVADL
ncbi:MAG: hypothetical protein R3A13_07340 [Bdellovibrionota bacterium]